MRTVGMRPSARARRLRRLLTREALRLNTGCHHDSSVSRTRRASGAEPNSRISTSPVVVSMVRSIVGISMASSPPYPTAISTVLLLYMQTHNARYGVRYGVKAKTPTSKDGDFCCLSHGAPDRSRTCGLPLRRRARPALDTLIGIQSNVYNAKHNWVHSLCIASLRCHLRCQMRLSNKLRVSSNSS